MAQLIAPGIARFSAEGVLGDRPWANVLDCEVNPAIADSREDACENTAKRIVDAYVALRPMVVAAWQLLRVRWVDLDSANGSTGETGDGTTVDAPFAGTGAHGDAMPGNVALLVKKQGAGGRQARSGRLYLCGLGEQQIAGNSPTSANVTALQTAMNTFLTNINDWDGNDATSQNRLVVVHAPAGVYGGSTPVDALKVQSRLASQRRRLRG